MPRACLVFLAVAAAATAPTAASWGSHWRRGLAALLFAVDDCHATPAGWLDSASRGERRCRPAVPRRSPTTAGAPRDGWRAGVVAELASLALALLSAEAGLGTFRLTWRRTPCSWDRGKWRGRLLASVAVRGRRDRLGESCGRKNLGYGVHGVEAYADPIGAAGAVLLRRASGDLAGTRSTGQWAFPPSDMNTSMTCCCRAAHRAGVFGAAVGAGFRRDGPAVAGWTGMAGLGRAGWCCRCCRCVRRRTFPWTDCSCS